jgi:hypothetical protein
MTNGAVARTIPALETNDKLDTMSMLIKIIRQIMMECIIAAVDKDAIYLFHKRISIFSFDNIRLLNEKHMR